MESQPPPLPSVERLASNIRKVMTNGVGYDYRGTDTTPDLERVAKEIVVDPDLESFGLCGAAVEQVIFRLGNGAYADAIRTAFRVSDDAKHLPNLKDRARLAAEKMGRKPVPLEDKDLRRMCGKLAEVMLKLAAEQRAASHVKKDEAPVVLADNSEAKDDAPTANPEQPGRPARRRWLTRITGVAVVVALLIAGGFWLHRPRASRSASAPSLTELKAQADRQLNLPQTPQPGMVSKTLGFGDSAGGRPVYPAVERSSMPDRPILNSLVDVPDGEDVSGRDPSGPGNLTRDEREFVTVLANPPNADTLETHPRGRSAHARWGSFLSIGVYLANNGWPGPVHCGYLAGPATATNVHLQVAIWDSPNFRLHVIRAWIEAGHRTYPAWVTDAVSVITEKPAQFKLDTSLSSESRYLKAEQYIYHPAFKRLKNDDVMWSQGMRVGRAGRLGACIQNRRYVSLIFRQRRPFRPY